MRTNGMQTEPKHRRCVECDEPIPVERLRLIPDTWTCVRHSGVAKRQDVPTVEVDGEEARESAEGTLWN